jgi:FHA domain
VPHITLSKTSTSKPSLEFYSDGSGESRRVSIENSPFRIGRAETADLRVESAEVSREHAEIIERNGVWLLRDLGSTNGTEVNGKSVRETILNDGDILKFATSELTFVASPASQFQRMVTQPIHVQKLPTAPCALPPEVAVTRTLIEATLWQAFATQIFAATSLCDGETEALFAPISASTPAQAHCERPHAICDRFRELERMRAIEVASNQAGAKRLFLAIEAGEAEMPRRLFSSLKQLQGYLPAGWEIGITISLPTDVDILRITELYREARDNSLLIAFDEFQGNGGQVMHLESLLPDYLLLAANMTKDLLTTRQPLRRMESLRTACDELAITPVLTHIEDRHAIALCQEIGFHLILQSVTNLSAMSCRPPAMSV